MGEGRWWYADLGFTSGLNFQGEGLRKDMKYVNVDIKVFEIVIKIPHAILSKLYISLSEEKKRKKRRSKLRSIENEEKELSIVISFFQSSS